MMAYMALHYYIYVNIRGTSMILANNNFLCLIKVYSRLNIIYLPCVRWLLFEIWINIIQHSPCRFWFFILSCPIRKLGSWLSWVGYPCMKCLLHTISSGFGVHVFFFNLLVMSYWCLRSMFFHPFRIFHLPWEWMQFNSAYTFTKYSLSLVKFFILIMPIFYMLFFFCNAASYNCTFLTAWHAAFCK